MRFYKSVWVFSLLLGLLCAPVKSFEALPEGAFESVVSVLPVWPGRAQGGTGGPPGVAPEGSGVVIRNGVVATAWHVVEPAERVDVRLSDGRILPGRLIAHDVASDIALLGVDADLVPVDFAPQPSLAEPVCAIGNAYGFGLSVTCGVVSAVSITNAGFNPVEDFVQTDAAANPGMSGGALVDADGRLIGMVSAIFSSETDTNIGVNFAVSTPLLMRVADALLERGEVRYPRPGWRLATASRDQLAQLAAPIVRSLGDGGAASLAGFELGDQIVEVGQRRVRTPRDVVAALALIPGDAADVKVTIRRDGAMHVIVLPLDRPEPAEAADAPTVLGDCDHPAPVCLVRQAVFPVSSFDPIASATRIGPNLLVTNRHVVGDRSDAVVHTPDGPRGATVIPSAYTGDLVLLGVSGLPDAGHIADLEPESQDSSVFYAVGADVSRQEVRVFDPGESIAEPDEKATLGRLHVTAPMQPGVSGGALVNEAGDLLGIAVGGGEGRYEAIPLEDVRTLLDLRTSGEAENVTTRLGTAFVQCSQSVDALQTDGADEEKRDEVIEICAIAANHGQLLEAGRVLAQIGDFDGATTLHAQAAEQVPNSINARVSLLVSLQLAARFEDMTEHARWVMMMAPDQPQILRFAIQSGVWGGEPDLAEAGYQALLEADPRQAEAARRFIDNAPPAPSPR